MAVKKSAATPAKPKSDPDTIKVSEGVDGITKDMSQSQLMANLVTRNALAAPTLKAYTSTGDGLEVSDLITELRKAGDEVVSGDMGRVERMLTNQLITLDAVFNSLAQRSSRQDYLKQMETYLKLALKAQAQSRATAEALALLKNPQPYIKQANIANGHQQVNNTYASASGHTGIPSGAGNFQSQPNKLLEPEDVVTLDSRAQSPTGRANPAMAAVG